jgi:hypothetical protein
MIRIDRSGRKFGLGTLFVAAFIAAVVFFGCGGKNGSERALISGKPRKNGVAGLAPIGLAKTEPTTPAPGVPAVPAVTTAQAAPARDLLIEYRHTGFSYAEVYGFDTYAYRFASLPDGNLESAVLLGRLPEGEAEISRFSFIRAGNEVKILESPRAKNPKDEEATTRVRATLIPAPQGGAVKGVFEGMVERTAEGFLSFRTLGGEDREEFRLGSGAEAGVFRRIQGGAVAVQGVYVREGAGALVYRERKVGDGQGAEDVSVTFEEDAQDLLRFRTEGVVPINEVRISGGDGCLKGNLLNLAIVDSVLGPDRRIRPALSYLYLR